jgi:hypothetical protein
MSTRPGVPALLLALALTAPVTLAAPKYAVPAASAAGAADGTCTTTALTGRTAIRTKSGTKLGTARMYTATSGEDLGFCVRITPVKRLRSKYTIASVKNETFDPTGAPSSSGLAGGSGYWKDPFLVTGTIFEPGSSMEATVTIKPSGGRKGTAKLTGTLS